MSDKDIALMAHLLRRAGFGATRDEIEAKVEQGYDNVVEEFLNPLNPNTLPDDIIRRYHVEQSELRQLDAAVANWMYRMITTECPLEEKLALFWHSLFATGYSKLNQARALLNQVDMFRTHGLGSFSNLLVELSRDPAMIIWLDNQDNHDGAINENFGRELLELFSMGIGNYTEEDVKECARAFTGWTLGNAEYMSMRASKDSIWPYSRIAWHFNFREHDHDGGEKHFLGETGNFSGEEIIDIIAKQEATARFVSTRLFQYFAADVVDEVGESVIKAMMVSYFESGYEIKSVLRTLFNSDYFKSDSARFARIKSPAETVVGAIRLAGTYREPVLGVNTVANHAMFMGQALLSPPSVEGWHEGTEWIDSGALVERVNFAAKELSDPSKPGICRLIERISNEGGTLSPEVLVDQCLDLVGPLVVDDQTKKALVDFASIEGDLDTETLKQGADKAQRVGDILRLIASTREFQLA
jgi:uncharacterized protein (DUF1800 family)